MTVADELHYVNVLRNLSRGTPDLAAQVDFVQSRRESKAESRAIDTHLLRELERQRKQLTELTAKQEDVRAAFVQLREEMAVLRSAPWHQVTFLGFEDVADRRLAVVLTNTGRAAVEVDGPVETTDLTPGDTVFLSQKGNVVVGRGGPCSYGETAVVARRLSDGRLVLNDRDAEVVVLPAGRLRDEAPAPGDQVVWNRRAMIAYDAIPITGDGPAFVRLENLRSEPPQLGGLDTIVEEILALFMLPLRHADVAARFGVGNSSPTALLCGPPGCGKTTIARRVAWEMGQLAGEPCRFAAVNGSELESPWVGQSQGNIRKLFEELNGSGPTILYIDEVEAIGRHRGSRSDHHSDKFLSQWLTSLDGFQKRDRVAVIASTNRKDLIDTALLERISGVEILIPRPSMQAARDVLAVHLRESYPYAEAEGSGDARGAVIDRIVSRLYDPKATLPLATVRFRDGSRRPIAARELVSGRLLQQIAEGARHKALRRVGRESVLGIRPEDAEDAVHDAIEKLIRGLTPHSLRHVLDDVPPDMDIVGVDAAPRPVRRHRYRAA